VVVGKSNRYRLADARAWRSPNENEKEKKKKKKNIQSIIQSKTRTACSVRIDAPIPTPNPKQLPIGALWHGSNQKSNKNENRCQNDNNWSEPTKPDNTSRKPNLNNKKTERHSPRLDQHRLDVLGEADKWHVAKHRCIGLRVVRMAARKVDPDHGKVPEEVEPGIRAHEMVQESPEARVICTVLIPHRHCLFVCLFFLFVGINSSINTHMRNIVWTVKNKVCPAQKRMLTPKSVRIKNTKKKKKKKQHASTNDWIRYRAQKRSAAWQRRRSDARKDICPLHQMVSSCTGSLGENKRLGKGSSESSFHFFIFQRLPTEKKRKKKKKKKKSFANAHPK
jgi:hypothetical protein